MRTRKRVLAPKRLQATFHLDLIGCMQTAIGLTPSGNPNPSFQVEITHWCKHSFGHNAQSNATLFPLWSFILTNFFLIPFWSLPVSEAEQDFWGVKGKHSKMNYIDATELILYRANRSFAWDEIYRAGLLILFVWWICLPLACIHLTWEKADIWSGNWMVSDLSIHHLHDFHCWSVQILPCYIGIEIFIFSWSAG